MAVNAGRAALAIGAPFTATLYSGAVNAECPCKQGLAFGRVWWAQHPEESPPEARCAARQLATHHRFASIAAMAISAEMRVERWSIVSPTIVAKALDSRKRARSSVSPQFLLP
jgi:hypothetical protein